MTVHTKHRFKFNGVEDFFLFQRLIFVCKDCFTICMTERDEFYKILTAEPIEVDWDNLWQ